MTPYLSFFDPSDAFSLSLNGKPAYPVFHVDSVQKADIEVLSPNCSEPHYSKAVPGKMIMKSYLPILHFVHMKSSGIHCNKLHN